MINMPGYFYDKCTNLETQKRFLDATCLLFWLFFQDETENSRIYLDFDWSKDIKTPEEYFESFLEMRNSWRGNIPCFITEKQEELTGKTWEDRLEAAFRWLLEELKNGTKIDINPSKNSEYYVDRVEMEVPFLERVGSKQKS